MQIKWLQREGKR